MLISEESKQLDKELDEAISLRSVAKAVKKKASGAKSAAAVAKDYSAGVLSGATKIAADKQARKLVTRHPIKAAGPVVKGLHKYGKKATTESIDLDEDLDVAIVESFFKGAKAHLQKDPKVMKNVAKLKAKWQELKDLPDKVKKQQMQKKIAKQIRKVYRL